MAAALVNPHLLGPLSHNYASLVVCLDLLWCIWVRTYTRELGPRGQDRNLELPRKSTLDFREAFVHVWRKLCSRVESRYIFLWSQCNGSDLCINNKSSQIFLDSIVSSLTPSTSPAPSVSGAVWASNHG